VLGETEEALGDILPRFSYVKMMPTEPSDEEKPPQPDSSTLYFMV